MCWREGTSHRVSFHDTGSVYYRCCSDTMGIVFGWVISSHIIFCTVSAATQVKTNRKYFAGFLLFGCSRAIELKIGEVAELWYGFP